MAGQSMGGGGSANEACVETNAGTAYIAQLFGVTPRRVRQLAAEGAIPATMQDGNYMFDPLEAAREYIRLLSDRLSGRVPEGTGKYARQILEFDADYKRTRARISELELLELEGRMHRSEEVEAMIAEMASMVRNALLAMPGRLASDMAASSSPAEASERLRQEAAGILDELAGYEYKPIARRQRADRRKGRQGQEGDAAIES